MAVIAIKLDTAEPRIARDRIDCLVDGTRWVTASDVAIDPITQSAILRPVQFDPTWQTNTSGIYARLRKTDYDLGTPSAWSENCWSGVSGDTFLVGRGTADLVRTIVEYPANQGMWLSWHQPQWGGERGTAIECAWGPEGDDQVGLRFWTDDQVEVWRGTVYLRTYSLSSVDRTRGSAVSGYEYGKPEVAGAADYRAVLMIPCRRTELLVINAAAPGGFSHDFDHMDRDVPDGTITTAGQFRWRVPTGQPVVQCAPIRYPTAGYVMSDIAYMRAAPGTSQIGTVIAYADVPSAGSVSGEWYGTAGTEAFVADGTADAARVRVALTGNGSVTPTLYAARGEYSAGTTTTWAGDIDVIQWTRAAEPPELSVGTGLGDTTFTLPLAAPRSLEDTAGLADPLTLSNRPIEVSCSGTVLFAGRTMAPEYTLGLTDDATNLTLECRDRWRALELYRASEQVPLDGMNLGSAIAMLVRMPGYPSSAVDVGTIDYTLPMPKSQSHGEWAHLVDVGDSPADHIRTLIDTYGANLYAGWVPTTSGVVFRVRSEGDLGTIPAGTVHFTAGTSSWHFWARTYRETVLQPECNELWVTGRSEANGNPISVYSRDEDAQDPTLDGPSRPGNWQGEPIKVALVDDRLMTEADCSYVFGTMWDRLTRARIMAEWECQMLWRADGAPIWRGDCVRVGTAGTFRVQSLRVRFPSENAEGGDGWRPATYVGEHVSD